MVCQLTALLIVVAIYLFRLTYLPFSWPVERRVFSDLNAILFAADLNLPGWYFPVVLYLPG